MPRTPREVAAGASAVYAWLQQQKLGEAFFEALTASSSFGVQYANRVIVACP